MSNGKRSKKSNNGRSGKATSNSRGGGQSSADSKYRARDNAPERASNGARSSLTISGTGTSLTFPLAPHLFGPVHYWDHKGMGIAIGAPIDHATSREALKAAKTQASQQTPSHNSFSSGKKGNGFPGTSPGGRVKKPTAAYALGAGTTQDGDEEDGLPVIHDTESVEGWKVGILKVASDQKTLTLMAPSTGMHYSCNETAVCGSGHGHKAPDVHCTCGFYAYYTFGDLKKYKVLKTYGSKQRGQVLLSLDLRGRLVEHERLIRAERQIINCVYLPGDCKDCADAAEVVMFVDYLPASYCRNCAKEAKDGFLLRSPTLTLAELRNMLGTEVRFFTEPGW